MRSAEVAALEDTEVDRSAAIDGLLDEIDAVLEDQTALVRFRQTPGQ